LGVRRQEFGKGSFHCRGISHTVFDDRIVSVALLVHLYVPGKGFNAIANKLVGNSPHQGTQEDHAPDADDDRS
jgi:hypothetical protein